MREKLARCMDMLVGRRLPLWAANVGAASAGFGVAWSFRGVADSILMGIERGWITGVAVAAACLAVVLLGVCVRSEDVQKSVSKRRACGVGIASVVAAPVGYQGSSWCYASHLCMCGHMAHGGEPAWHYAADLGWALAYLVPGALSAWLGWRTSLFWTALGSFFISIRFAFGSFGGISAYFPL